MKWQVAFDLEIELESQLEEMDESADEARDKARGLLDVLDEALKAVGIKTTWKSLTLVDFVRD